MLIPRSIVKRRIPSIVERYIQSKAEGFTLSTSLSLSVNKALALRHEVKGFTFVELIVVMGILIMIMPILFGIVMVLSRQQVKVYRLSQVKREGDYALNLIENTIRNYATGIYADQSFSEDDADADPPITTNRLCDNSSEDTVYPGTTYFRDRFDNWFRYTVSSDTLSSSSAVLGTPLALTSNKVNISNLSITCRLSSDFSSSIILIKFDVNYNYGATITPSVFEDASLHYTTRIKLRND